MPLLSLTPPPTLPSFLALFILSAVFISPLESLHLFSPHTHCHENMGIVTALIKRQRPPPTHRVLFLPESPNKKRIVQQVTSQPLQMTMCGKVLETVSCGWQGRQSVVAYG